MSELEAWVLVWTALMLALGFAFGWVVGVNHEAHRAHRENQGKGSA